MIELLAMNCFLIWGIFAITQEGKLLYKPKLFFEACISQVLAKPLFNCPTCMSSFWGTVFYIAQFGLIGDLQEVFSFGFNFQILSTILGQYFLWLLALAGLMNFSELLMLAFSSMIEYKRTLVDEGLLENILNK